MPVFRFLPGEKVQHIVGMPGPDMDDCEVIADDGGPKVHIKYQVYGRGKFHEDHVPRTRMGWRSGTPEHDRYIAWAKINAPHLFPKRELPGLPSKGY